MSSMAAPQLPKPDLLEAAFPIRIPFVDRSFGVKLDVPFVTENRFSKIDVKGKPLHQPTYQPASRHVGISATREYTV